MSKKAKKQSKVEASNKQLRKQVKELEKKLSQAQKSQAQQPQAQQAQAPQKERNNRKYSVHLDLSIDDLSTSRSLSESFEFSEDDFDSQSRSAKVVGSSETVEALQESAPRGADENLQTSASGATDEDLQDPALCVAAAILALDDDSAAHEVVAQAETPTSAAACVPAETSAESLESVESEIPNQAMGIAEGAAAVYAVDSLYEEGGVQELEPQQVTTQQVATQQVAAQQAASQPIQQAIPAATTETAAAPTSTVAAATEAAAKPEKSHKFRSFLRIIGFIVIALAYLGYAYWYSTVHALDGTQASLLLQAKDFIGGDWLLSSWNFDQSSHLFSSIMFYAIAAGIVEPLLSLLQGCPWDAVTQFVTFLGEANDLLIYVTGQALMYGALVLTAVFIFPRKLGEGKRILCWLILFLFAGFPLYEAICAQGSFATMGMFLFFIAGLTGLSVTRLQKDKAGKGKYSWTQLLLALVIIVACSSETCLFFVAIIPCWVAVLLATARNKTVATGRTLTTLLVILVAAGAGILLNRWYMGDGINSVVMITSGTFMTRLGEAFGALFLFAGGVWGSFDVSTFDSVICLIHSLLVIIALLAAAVSLICSISCKGFDVVASILSWALVAALLYAALGGSAALRDTQAFMGWTAPVLALIIIRLLHWIFTPYSSGKFWVFLGVIIALVLVVLTACTAISSVSQQQYSTLARTQTTAGQSTVLDYLTSNNMTRGFADFEDAAVLTVLSDETICVAPLQVVLDPSGAGYSLEQPSYLNSNVWYAPGNADFVLLPLDDTQKTESSGIVSPLSWENIVQVLGQPDEVYPSSGHLILQFVDSLISEINLKN